MSSVYHKAVLTILIICTLLFIQLVDSEEREVSKVKTSIINKEYQALSLDGVLDRIEDGQQAIILIEELSEEVVVPLSELPVGSREQMWFNIEVSDDEFSVISINEEKTKKEATESTQIMEQLRKEKQDELPDN